MEKDSMFGFPNFILRVENQMTKIGLQLDRSNPNYYTKKHSITKNLTH